MQPGTSRVVARSLAVSINLFFLSSSVVLFAFAAFATINPPLADISPERVNSYPQYIITLLLIASYSVCLFLLSSLGLLALFVFNSFLISVHILAQLAMMVAQLVAIAFTMTVRKRLHYKLEETWQQQQKCVMGSECQPLRRFLQSETLLIVALCVFLLVQLALLVSSGYLAEKLSMDEKLKQLQLREEEADDD